METRLARMEQAVKTLYKCHLKATERVGDLMEAGIRAVQRAQTQQQHIERLEAELETVKGDVVRAGWAWVRTWRWGWGWGWG